MDGFDIVNVVCCCLCLINSLLYRNWHKKYIKDNCRMWNLATVVAEIGAVTAFLCLIYYVFIYKGNIHIEFFDVLEQHRDIPRPPSLNLYNVILSMIDFVYDLGACIPVIWFILMIYNLSMFNKQKNGIVVSLLKYVYVIMFVIYSLHLVIIDERYFLRGEVLSYGYWYLGDLKYWLHLLLFVIWGVNVISAKVRNKESMVNQ